MRVGVYAPAFSPEDGGGYTYQRDIVDAICAIRSEAHHEFVLVGHAAKPPSGWTSSEYISLGQSWANRALRRVQRTVEAASEGHVRSPRLRSDELFAERQVDLLWSVTAGVPTRELPYVTTILDLQHRRQPFFPEVSRAGEWDRRERFFVREIGAAAKVIVGNATGQAEVERFYGVFPDRVARLAHPTPSFALNPGPDTDVIERFELDPGYLLYPAQFWAHKNHVAVIESLAILRDRHQLKMTAVFVGSDQGNRSPVLRVADSFAVRDQVRVLGFVSRADLVTLYRRAFALTYVTFFGPENLPPLEAFALGCPVIASNVAGADEQLGDAAILVDPEKPELIATAVVSLKSDARLRVELIQRGRARAQSQTPSRYVAGMLTILDELAAYVRTWR